MGNIFSDRISDVPRSFIREILKVASDSSVISFAGGLPNRNLFPLREIRAASVSVLDEDGLDALQYSSSEGYQPLREWIARRYREKAGIELTAEQILITTGSQQGLDLLAKTFLNEKDRVIIEEPGYLGAIQAFSLYKASFVPLAVNENGIDPGLFSSALGSEAKLFYCVPNFQNPSGISYPEENRREIARLLQNTHTLLIEDDPYGELRFSGRSKPSFFRLSPEKTVLLGSFSKVVAPSFRIGWIATSERSVMDKLVIAKQASDLHTNYIGQRVIHRYLADNDFETHLDRIRTAYGSQRNAMTEAIREFFPGEVQHTEPEGGMFLWAVMPEGLSALKIFERSIEKKVAFVPGDPFYVGKTHLNTMRLNFSSVDEDTIRKGIKILGEVLKQTISR